MSIATDLIKYYEGFYGKAYRCDGGKWTIGWGTTVEPGGKRISADTYPIDRAIGEVYLENDLKAFIAQLEKEFNNFNQWEDSKQAALIAFVYNCGLGTMRKCRFYKAIKAGKSDQEVADLLANSVTTAAGKPLKGLQRRRLAESLVYLGVGVAEAVEAANKAFP